MGKKIQDVRRRLAALKAPSPVSGSKTPATALADCRVLQSHLRELKREVLGQIAAHRADLGELAREELRASNSASGEPRQEGSKLLDDVRRRVIGMVEGKASPARQRRRRGKVLEAWSRLSEDIDARLEQLERLESRLARDAGENDDLYLQNSPRLPPSPPPVPQASPRTSPSESGARTSSGDAQETSDDIYAAVGASVQQQGQSASGYCSHCGQGLDPEDRFCRQCGHRL